MLRDLDGYLSFNILAVLLCFPNFTVVAQGLLGVSLNETFISACALDEESNTIVKVVLMINFAD